MVRRPVRAFRTIDPAADKVPISRRTAGGRSCSPRPYQNQSKSRRALTSQARRCKASGWRFFPRAAALGSATSRPESWAGFPDTLVAKGYRAFFCSSIAGVSGVTSPLAIVDIRRRIRRSSVVHSNSMCYFCCGNPAYGRSPKLQLCEPHRLIIEAIERALGKLATALVGWNIMERNFCRLRSGTGLLAGSRRKTCS